MITKPELLAPAGSMEALIAAVENGADAVYLGAKSLSARGYANNFTPQELEKAIDYAHLRGVRAYVTANTLISDEEMEEAAELLYELSEIGADAVIVQDLGILSLAREIVPDLPIHSSTQMTIHNSEGVRFLQRKEVERVVLAREMSLDEIKKVKQETGAELEVFVHGALCICYSGQCLLSSMIGGRSGNRGYCAQPCRKKYRLRKDGRYVDTDGEYLWSPKDLNTAQILPQLIDSGIDSLKIEGRMKRPEYVAGVVRTYRDLIDRYADDPAGYFVSKEEENRLRQLFNRDFTTAYLTGDPRGDLMSRKIPYNRGIPIGKAIGYDRKRKSLRVKLSGELKKGDGIGIQGLDDIGETVHRMYERGKAVEHAGKGNVVDIPFKTHVEKERIVYRTLDSELMKSLQTSFTSPSPIRKIPVKIEAKAEVGSPLTITIEDMDSNTVNVSSEYIVQRAEKRPTTIEQMEKQLSKLGNTVFQAENIRILSEDEIFIPIKELNDARSEAVSRLEDMRTGKWKRTKHERQIPSPKCEQEEKERPLLSVLVDSLEDMQSAISGGADVIYIGGEVYRDHEAFDLAMAVDIARNAGCSIYLNTPRIAKDDQMQKVRETVSLAKEKDADGILASNLGTLRLAKQIGVDVIADSPLNIFNKQALNLLKEYDASKCVLSPELTLEQIKDIAYCASVECMVHGRLTLMESQHCLVGGILAGKKKCNMPCMEGNFEVVDEKGYAFPIRMDTDCRSHMLNSRQLCMLEHIPEVINAGVSSIRVDARTVESRHIEKIVKAYRDAMDTAIEQRSIKSMKCKDITDGYTTGHYYRGVK